MERALLRHPRGCNRSLAGRSILFPLALVLATALPRTTGAQSSFWEPITGPGGGSVTDLARQPDGDLFAAMAGGPIYRSWNGGGSWEPLSHSARRLAALANGDLYALGSSGIQRSRDDGASWTDLGGPAHGVDLVMTPTGRLLLSLDGPNWGLHRSDDDGVTWEPVGQFGRIAAIVVEENGTVTVGVQAELQQSFDDGDHWTTVTTLPTTILALARRPTGEWIISTLACLYFPCSVPQGLFRYDGSNPPSFEYAALNASSIVVRSDGTAFAATEGFCALEMGGAIYSSTSPGSWTPVSGAATTALVVSEPDGIFAATGPFCGHVVVYPGRGVLSTSGPGTTWEARNDGLVHSTSMALATAPGILYAQNGSSLAWSIDAGRTWDATSTFIPTGLVDLVLAAHPAGDVFATASYYIARPGGPTSSLGASQFARTQDRGLTWTDIELYSGVHGTLTTTASGNLVLSDYRGGVSRSTDRGDSWTHESAGAPVEVFASIGSGRSARVFAATQSETYLSEDDARTWSRIGGVGGNRIAVAPDEAAVYVLGEGPVHRVMEVAPGDWVESALPPGPSGPLAVDAQGTVYIASNTVSRLGSGDTQWQEIPGTPDLGGESSYEYGRRSILFDAAGFLYVGTGDRSVLRSRLPVGSTTDATPGTTFLAFQPGPTPFRDATTFGLVLSQSERVSLVLFDVRGRTVSKLWHRTDLGPGRHVARWLPEAGTASGSYFYRLDVGATSRTGRVTLVR